MIKTHEPSLFIPGPTEVFPEVLAELSRPVVSHRGPEIAEITEDIFGGLRQLFQTKQETFVALSSATGLMEGAVRNLVGRRLLVVVCGAFSERMFSVAVKNGIAADALEVPWGEAINIGRLAEKLKTADYDAVACVHSETSTGILNPLAEVAAVVRQKDDCLLITDVVSSLGGAEFAFDDWGVDLAFGGIQKCMALPPGLCLFAVSERAMERAEKQPHRGHYFDFLNYRKMAARSQSPATTAISLMYALRFQLARIQSEGLEARWQRHRNMAKKVRGRLGPRFALFCDQEFMTPTETVFRAPQDFDVLKAVAAVKAKGKLFATGYGPLKESTFRIGHMGDLDVEHIEAFLDLFEDVLIS